MDFDTLMTRGWAEHHKDGTGTRALIEGNLALADDPDRAGRLGALVNHLYGVHEADWTRATELLRDMVSALTPPDEGSLCVVLGRLALAQYLAHEVGPALATEALAASLSPTPLEVFVRVRLLAAEALAEGDDWATVGALYRPAMRLAATLPEDSAANRSAAIVSNNLSSKLVESAERTAEQDALMSFAAAQAKHFWGLCGNWVNDERADYLLAMVHNATGAHETALEVAQRGLATIGANGEEKIDEAFLSLQAAAAFKGLGQSASYDERIAHAESLAEDFPEGLKGWFAEELGKVAK